MASLITLSSILRDYAAFTGESTGGSVNSVSRPRYIHPRDLRLEPPLLASGSCV